MACRAYACVPPLTRVCLCRGGSVAFAARRAAVAYRDELGEVTQSFANKHAAIKLKVRAPACQRARASAHSAYTCHARANGRRPRGG